MSALYGGLTGNTKLVTRRSRVAQRAFIQTEYGRIEIFMLDDGRYEITRYVVRSGRTVDHVGTTLLMGNVNEECREEQA